MNQYQLNKFALATYNEIYDTERNNGEWNYNHEETHESFYEIIKSYRKNLAEAKAAEIAGLKFIAFPGLSIVDFGDCRIVIHGVNLTDFI